jgi:iron complex outermembrane receptor protein
MKKIALLAGVAASLFPYAASAQTTDTNQPAPPATGQPVTPEAEQDAPPAEQPAIEGDHHGEEAATIIVTGFRRNRQDVLSGTSVLSGQELQRDLRPTIGETLSRQPGVSATSFGPNASRPVLRGQQGERIRVLTDGIGSLDVSNTSVDHAVAINPLTAERIEVLRGPAALLFGSAAIGGVVNVIDARIPRRLPTEGFHADGILTYGSAANERSGNLRVDLPIGGGFVAHADGNYTRTDDLRIGGFVLSPQARAEALARPDAAVRALAGLSGRLANTASETSDVAAGLAWIGGATNVGFSVNQYDSLYGVPARFSLEPGVEVEAPRIDVHQRRVDGRAEFGIGSGFLESVRLRGGYSDYRHNELEEDGAVGTTFLTKGAEGRLEFAQRRRGGWGGGFGAQYFTRSLEVIGDEKFLPANTTRQFGLFALESLDLGSFRAEVGGRFEHQENEAEADADLGNPAISRRFDLFSGSVGASYGIAEGLRAGVNLSRTARAPSGEELFANGPHAGTQAFEIGDPDLEVERSWGLEGTLRLERDAYSFSVAVFHSWFDNYIYQAQTGAEQGGLPVFETLQSGARYFGAEFEASARVATIGGYTLNLDAVADYVEATVDNAGPAPRIPPLRLLGGVELQSDQLTGRIEAEHAFRQDRTALNETPTEGFTLINASINWHPVIERPDIRLTLSANNIFDVDARRHASFLKDFAPLPGRDIRATLHLSF